MKTRQKLPKKPIKKSEGEIEVESIADFVNAVSHDLKNPLASIKAYTEIAKKKLQEIGEKKIALYINKIEEQTDRAFRLITDLLDTSRIAGGKIFLHKTSFRLDRLVKEVTEDYQLTINTHKIIAERKIEVKITADKERIRRVLYNLLTNAVKYSPGADKIIVNITKDLQNAIVSIQDFGVGIPKSKQDNLFDPYFRVKEGGKTQVQGYGLGLPIVKRIIEAHNGRIWFESQKGKGSTFYFSIPLNNPEREQN